MTIKRGLALVLGLLVLVQIDGGLQPAEAEEVPAVYETVARQDGSVVELVSMKPQRTMTMRAADGNETTTAEMVDGSVVTVCREKDRTRLAVSLSQTASEAAGTAVFALPLESLTLGEPEEMSLTLELPQAGEALLALPLEDAAAVRVQAVGGAAAPVSATLAEEGLVLSLAAGETVVLTRA